MSNDSLKVHKYSRLDDPEYQKQVSLQMLATPTHEIACRAITDLRRRVLALEMEGLKMFELLDTILTEFEDRYDGAPDAHMQWMGTLMHEIESLKAKL